MQQLQEPGAQELYQGIFQFSSALFTQWESGQIILGSLVMLMAS